MAVRPAFRPSLAYACRAGDRARRAPATQAEQSLEHSSPERCEAAQQPLVCDPTVDLHERRIRMHQGGEVLHTQAMGHGECIFLDEIPGARADDGSTEYSSSGCGDELGEADRL